MRRFSILRLRDLFSVPLWMWTHVYCRKLCISTSNWPLRLCSRVMGRRKMKFAISGLVSTVCGAAMAFPEKLTSPASNYPNRRVTKRQCISLRLRAEPLHCSPFYSGPVMRKRVVVGFMAMFYVASVFRGRLVVLDRRV